MEISKLNLDGMEYDLKDEFARKEIDILKNRKYIIISDSYGTVPTNQTFIDYFKNYMNLFESVNIFTQAVGGYGFAVPDATFLSLLQHLDTVITNKDEITDVIVVGGYNDSARATQDEIINSIGSFVDHVNGNYVNAKVHIAHVGWSLGTNDYDFKNLRMSINAYRIGATTKKAQYINNIEYTLHSYDLLDISNIHPNEYGAQAIAQNLINGLKTGSCNCYYAKTYNTSQVTELNGSWSAWCEFLSVTNNGQSQFSLRTKNDAPLNYVEVTGSFYLSNFPLTLFKYERAGQFRGDYTTNQNSITIPCQVGTESETLIMPITFTWINGAFTMSAPIINPITCTWIRIPNFTMTSDSLYC